MILTFGSVEEIRFIDCEHMGYNYAGFDIAHLYVGITGLEPGTLQQFQQKISEIIGSFLEMLGGYTS